MLWNDGASVDILTGRKMNENWGTGSCDQEVTVFIPDNKKMPIKHPSNQITKVHNKVHPNLTKFKMNLEILKLNTYKLNYNSI